MVTHQRSGGCSVFLSKEHPDGRVLSVLLAVMIFVTFYPVFLLRCSVIRRNNDNQHREEADRARKRKKERDSATRQLQACVDIHICVTLRVL